MAVQKNVVLSIGLLVVILFGVLLVGRRLTKGPPPPPESVTGREIVHIDKDSFQIITKTWTEWQDLGRQGPYYKNPETGKYTMTTIVICPMCLQKIPYPPHTEEEEEDEAAAMKPWIVECPKCNKMFDTASMRPWLGEEPKKR